MARNSKICASPFRCKLFVLLYTISASVGASSGYGIQIKNVVNKDGEPIGSVCILPAYRKVTGLGFGPDATGSRTLPNIYLLRPYLFNSGENIVGNLVRNERKLISLPLLISAGETLSFVRLLVLKDGYKPAVLRRRDVYSGGPTIMLLRTAYGESKNVISYIKNYKKHQSDLQTMFDVRKDIIVEYADDDMLLLKSCVENNLMEHPGQRHRAKQ